MSRTMMNRKEKKRKTLETDQSVKEATTHERMGRLRSEKNRVALLPPPVDRLT